MWCLKCEYELHATPDGPCPECGRVFARSDPKSFRWLDDETDQENRVFWSAAGLAAWPLVIPLIVALPTVATAGVVLGMMFLAAPSVLVAAAMCLCRELRRRPGRRMAVLMLAGLSSAAWIVSAAWASRFL